MVKSRERESCVWSVVSMCVGAINVLVSSGDSQNLLNCLQDRRAQLHDVSPQYIDAYLRHLAQLKTARSDCPGSDLKLYSFVHCLKKTQTSVIFWHSFFKASGFGKFLAEKIVKSLLPSCALKVLFISKAAWLL